MEETEHTVILDTGADNSWEESVSDYAQEKDRSEKYLEDYPDVFADITNNLLLKKKIIREEQLIPGPTESIYKAEGGEALKEQRRDVCKYVQDAGIIVSMIGLENQSKQDGDMPFRIMGYDYGSYRGQIVKGKERYPVLSSVLYFGKQPWTRPLTLKTLFDLPAGFEQVFADYHVNLIDVPRLSEEDRSRLTSDFKAVADFFANRDKPDYQPSRQKLKHVEAVLQLLRVFTRDKRYEEIEDEIMKSVENGEEASMCEFAERMEQRGIAKGITQGISQGISQGIRGAAAILKDMGIADAEIEQRVAEKFAVSEEEVGKYLQGK